MIILPYFRHFQQRMCLWAVRHQSCHYYSRIFVMSHSESGGPKQNMLSSHQACQFEVFGQNLSKNGEVTL